jgi:hypothetical protein
VVLVIFKNIFHSKCIKIIFFYFKKKLFLIPAHQNDLKIYKNNLQKKHFFTKQCLGRLTKHYLKTMMEENIFQNNI